MTQPLSASFVPESDPTDSFDLVGRAKAGDKLALDQLLVRYQDRILRIAHIRLGAKLRRFLDSADIVNQANWVVAQKIKTFEPKDKASIIHWLARIVENQIRDGNARHRSDKRDMQRDLPLRVRAANGESTDQPIAATDTSPIDAASRAELQALYDECLQELEPDHREVILLRDYGEGSWEFVCTELGRSNVHATQELYRRAQFKLGRLLGRRIKN